MSSEHIHADQAPEPVGAYPHARRVGNLLFLSGVGPRQRGSKQIPGVTLDASGNIESYDIEVQCHSVFRNVKLIHAIPSISDTFVLCIPNDCST